MFDISQFSPSDIQAAAEVAPRIRQWLASFPMNQATVTMQFAMWHVLEVRHLNNALDDLRKDALNPHAQEKISLTP